MIRSRPHKMRPPPALQYKYVEERDITSTGTSERIAQQLNQSVVSYDSDKARFTFVANGGLNLMLVLMGFKSLLQLNKMSAA